MTDAHVSAAYVQAVLGEARDGDVKLRIDGIYQSDNSPWEVPAYRFNVLEKDLKAGSISFRASDDARLVRYAGHIGFSIDEKFRGRRLAGRAVRLLLPLGASYGLKPLWLGCNPDNLASMQVMNWLGAEYVETIDVPPDYERYYSRGERQKRRYRLNY
jgi:predicted acetyltransferase